MVGLRNNAYWLLNCATTGNAAKKEGRTRMTATTDQAKIDVRVLFGISNLREKYPTRRNGQIRATHTLAKTYSLATQRSRASSVESVIRRATHNFGNAGAVKSVPARRVYHRGRGVVVVPLQRTTARTK